MELRSNMPLGMEQRVRSLLSKASSEELQGNSAAAAMTYRTVLQMLPQGAPVPPWILPELKRARDVVEANNRALEAHIEKGLEELRKRYPDEPLQRFDQCVDTLLQKRRIYRQQPTFMFFPELPTIEFYSRHHFPWLEQLEAAADDIRTELLDVLSDGREALEPYVADQPGLPMDKWRELNHSRRWGVYLLSQEGKVFAEHIARCPKTVAAVNACPRFDVPGNGPTALFSILDARTHIPSHTGQVNTRLFVHLPLIVPPGCSFRVGGQKREWEAAKAWVFDDTIDHEAWNDGNEPRAVLIFDVWSPFLSEAERELIRALTARMSEFYGTTSASRGL